MRLSGPLCLALAGLCLWAETASGITLDRTFQQHLNQLKRPKSGWSLWHLHEAARIHRRVPDGQSRYNATLQRLKNRKSLPELIKGEVLTLLGRQDTGPERAVHLTNAGHPNEITFLGPLKGPGLKERDPHSWTKTPVPGVFGLTAWRSLSSPQLSGALANGDLLHCSGDCHGMVEAWVETSRQSTATLVISSNGPFRAWVDDVKAAEWDGERSFRPWQHAVDIDLEPGYHRFTLQFGHREKTPRFSFRLIDTKDGTLKNSRFVARTSATAKKADAKAAVLGSRGLLQKFSSDEDLAARLALIFTSTKTALAGAESFFRKQLEKSPNDVAIWALLARSLSSSPNEARKAWLKAYELSASTHSAALANLYNLEIDNGRLASAIERCRELNETDPDHPNAIECDLRWFAEALGSEAALNRLTLRQKGMALSLEVELLRLEFLEQAEQYYRAAELGLQLSRKLGGHIGMLRRAARALSRAGKRSPAITSVKALRENRPYSVDAIVLEAELLAAEARDVGESKGKPDFRMALRALDLGLKTQPYSPEIHEARGRLLLEAGNRAAGLDAIDLALSMRPQSQDLATWRRTLTDQASLSTAHKRSLDTFLKSQKKVSAASEGATILFDKQVIEVHDNALSTRWRQRVIRIDTTQGAKQFSSIRLPYTPGVERMQVIEAEIRRKNGGTARPDRIHDERPPGKQHGIYTLGAFRVIRLPKLEPGDVVHVQTQLSPLADNNLFGPHFGTFLPTQDQWPIEESSVVVIVPQAMTLQHERVGSGSWTYQKLTGQDSRSETIHTWKGRGVPPLKYEPLMPGYADVGGTLSLSTFTSWDALVSWYQGFIRDQLTLTPQLKAIASRLTLDKATTRARVEAIHRWVVDNTRYVGIEFGIHGFKPYSLAEVMRRGYGDCKDKAALFIAMLGAVGISSEFVLIRTRDRGNVTTTVPSLWVFNHAIAYVPELDVYVDATSERAALGEVPRLDQGGSLLRFPILASRRTTGTLATLPFSPAKSNVYRSTATVSLRADGGASALFRETIQGTQAPSMRAMFDNRAEQKSRLRRVLSQNYPGASLTNFGVRGLKAGKDGVTLELGANIPGFASVRDGVLSIPVHADPEGLLERYGPEGHRTHPLNLPFLSTEVTKTALELPEGSKLLSFPAPSFESTNMADYRLSVSQNGTIVTVEEELVFKTAQVAPADYAAFRRFLEAVSIHRKARLRVSTGPAASAKMP